MPPRNNPVPNAVRLFNCTICDKGYPRQLDYENHLRSYDHNHRQRLADMKKLTAGNDTESNKPKQGLDMRSINVEDANKKPGVGSRFTKIGGAAGGISGGSRFKKVGVKAGENADEKKIEEKKVAEEKPEIEPPSVLPSVEVDHEVAAIANQGASSEPSTKEDVTMTVEDDEEEAITWEEYDFTKPTGCDHASCSGCKIDGIWSGEWVAVETA